MVQPKIESCSRPVKIIFNNVQKLHRAIIWLQKTYNII